MQLYYKLFIVSKIRIFYFLEYFFQFKIKCSEMEVNNSFSIF